MDFFFPEDNLNRMTPEETRITALSAEPYPDGYRLHVNIEMTPFQKRPHLEVDLNNADGDMFCPLMMLFKNQRSESHLGTESRAAGWSPAWRPSVFPLLAVYALSGFTALSLEMLWFRLLQVLLVANTYTFALLLCFYLSGIALGAELAAFLVNRISRPQKVFFSLQFAACQWGLLGPLLVWAYLGSRGTVFSAPGFNFPTELGNPYLLVALIILPATIMMGASFPFIQKIVSSDLPTLARRTGSLLFAKTLGAFLGCALTGLVFLYVIGTWHTLAFLSFLG